MKDKVTIEIISGCEGSCLAIDDTRVAGPKPWGGGHIAKSWIVDTKDILNTLYITTSEIRPKILIRKSKDGVYGMHEAGKWVLSHGAADNIIKELSEIYGFTFEEEN